MTKYQALILSLVRRAPRHLTAEQIFLLAKEEAPRISMATVYNSLSALTESGDIRRTHIAGDAAVYDRSVKMHEHLVCDSCGQVRDLEIPNLTRLLSDGAGEQLTSYEVNLHYLCPACRTS